MTFLGSTCPYYGGGQVANPANVIPTTGAPSTNLKVKLGTLAVDNSTGTIYGAASLSGGVTTWAILGGGTGAVATETGDTGTATPSGGNIKHAGTANQITTAASGATITYSLPVAITAPGSLTATTSLSATTTVTAGTGLTVTTGDLAVSAGNANVTGNVVASKSAAAANVTVQATNSDNTSGTSNAGVEIASGGSSGGDPYLSFQISGVGASTMTMGLDNSSSDTFVISNSSAIGTSNALTLTQAGALGATTSVTAGTSMTATLGDITATNGNFVASAAGTGLSLPVATGSGVASGSVTCNGRVGSVTFTSVSIASNADLTLTLANSSIAGASTRLLFSMSGATTGSGLSVKSVTPGIGTYAWVVTNADGAAIVTSVADITFDFIVLN